MSREGVTNVGETPTAVVIASAIAKVVTGSSERFRLSFAVPNFRGTFEIRYDFHEDDLSICLPFSVLMPESFSARVSEFPFVGHIAKPVFVGRIFARRWPSGPSLDLRSDWRA